MTLLLAALAVAALVFVAWCLCRISALSDRRLRFLDAPGEPSRAEPGDPLSPGSAFDVKWEWVPWTPYQRGSDWRPLLTVLTDNDKDTA